MTVQLTTDPDEACEIVRAQRRTTTKSNFHVIIVASM
jgi:hypothetical protein